MSRTPLQDRVRQAAIDAGMDPDVLDAADHPLDCKCPKCLKYWISAEPKLPVFRNVSGWDMWEEDMDEWRRLCPFTEEEIEDGRSSQIDSLRK